MLVGASRKHLSDLSFFFHNQIIKEKGKPVERRGRKANGSKARKSYDSQVARDTFPFFRSRRDYCVPGRHGNGIILAPAVPT
jgi:hypothetical protein